jgi:type IV secretory pathway ATPase VirB11/archaellum biosynthesis ATPase
MVERPHGIVLVTGPTGSGKTTTLYSTLKHLATPELNVCTVEDPIEMVSPEFNQMQVQRRSIWISPPACARCCDRIRTSSWSAKSAIWKPRRWRCRRR